MVPVVPGPRALGDRAPSPIVEKSRRRAVHDHSPPANRTSTDAPVQSGRHAPAPRPSAASWSAACSWSPVDSPRPCLGRPQVYETSRTGSVPVRARGLAGHRHGEPGGLGPDARGRRDPARHPADGRGPRRRSGAGWRDRLSCPADSLRLRVLALVRSRLSSCSSSLARKDLLNAPRVPMSGSVIASQYHAADGGAGLPRPERAQHPAVGLADGRGPDRPVRRLVAAAARRRPQGRNLVISCGAALHHAQVAAAAFGLDTVVTRLPDPSSTRHLASLALVPAAYQHPDAAADLRALELRTTDRQRFTDWPIPEERLARSPPASPRTVSTASRSPTWPTASGSSCW